MYALCFEYGSLDRAVDPDLECSTKVRDAASHNNIAHRPRSLMTCDFDLMHVYVVLAMRVRRYVRRDIGRVLGRRGFLVYWFGVGRFSLYCGNIGRPYLVEKSRSFYPRARRWPRVCLGSRFFMWLTSLCTAWLTLILRPKFRASSFQVASPRGGYFQLQPTAYANSTIEGQASQDFQLYVAHHVMDDRIPRRRADMRRGVLVPLYNACSIFVSCRTRSPYSSILISFEDEIICNYCSNLESLLETRPRSTWSVLPVK
ncbi:hypothetical protein AG1IA_09764 [Rhizoctonia solani AG-1 IA]|uniref:Uncharacterized protein n=1 Tax=Thanatephorus cucumeris (strain AG1-IA) TaxID=983506 RepID=L8WE38_THACA|nr:hypothetical protein AG1IA_09764 [Rhizoctonia solani AG-1 IA]